MSNVRQKKKIFINWINGFGMPMNIVQALCTRSESSISNWMNKKDAQEGGITNTFDNNWTQLIGHQ